MDNKYIRRDGQDAPKIFDNRSLAVDYRTLSPLIQTGMRVLDIGCGTGAISKDVAQLVGPTGQVIGIDNTARFIESGKQSYQEVKNLELIHVDLFDYHPEQPFDLIIAARVLQWLSDSLAALHKIKDMLVPSGQVSILDYNHNRLEWNPEPPASMRAFYDTFLRWRKDAGMNNGIADDLAEMMTIAGFHSIEVINSDEHYTRERADYQSKVGIWSYVAGSSQMVEEGYLDDALRLQAIQDYNQYVDKEAISMTMKLNEVRGIK